MKMEDKTKPENGRACGQSTTPCSHKKLFPENPTFKEAQAMSSVDEMREAISCHRLHSPIVRHAFDLAISQGLSEDDTMVILAFHAVSQYEHIQEKLIDELYRKPASYIIKHDV